MFRRAIWRLGRRLYMSARGEGVNDMRSNGETWLQLRVLQRAKAQGISLVILDIGANVGDWTMSFLNQALHEGVASKMLQIHAFEPVPGTGSMLRARLGAAADAERVTVWPVALSDASGTVAMHIVGDGAGTNSLEGTSGAGQSIEVKRETLDSFCEMNGIDHVDLVKCDTEGHDLSVLRGARRMLSDGRIDIFQFEYNSRWIYPGSNLKQVFDFLGEIPSDYALGRLCPNRIEIFEGWHQELDRFFETNMVVIRRDMVGAVPCHFGRFDAANTYA